MSTDPTPDPALVELVARALAASRRDPAFTIEGGEHWGRAHWSQIQERPRAANGYRAEARAVLSALTAAGYQVLPPDGETREEWGTRIKPHGEYDEEFCESFHGAGMAEKERAYARAEVWARKFGADLVDVMRREIHVGPWQSATEETPPAALSAPNREETL